MNLLQFLPAMEAEDITDEAKSGAAQAAGAPKSDRPKEDLGKTDDIFGLKDNNKDAGNEADPGEDATPEDDTTDDPTDDATDTDDNNDVNDDSLDDNTDEDTTTEPDDDIDETPPEEDSIIPNETQQKKKLMNNMILLYNIICNNIKLLADYTTQVAVASEESKVLYHITENLTDCKDILFRVISTNFASNDYITLMKTYVGINRVYDLCAEMLNKHFDNLELQATPTHIKHKKKSPSKKSDSKSGANK